MLMLNPYSHKEEAVAMDDIRFDTYMYMYFSKLNEDAKRLLDDVIDDSKEVIVMDDNNFDIYFSDLNEDAQKRLLDAVGVDDPKEMNWDIDMCPIAMYPIPED